MESKHGLRYVRLEFKEESQNLFLRYDCKETKYTKTISRVVEDRYATEFIYQMKEKGLKKDSFGFYGDRKDKRFTLKQMKYQFKSYCKKNRFSVGESICYVIIERLAYLSANRYSGRKEDFTANVFITKNGDILFGDKFVSYADIEDVLKKGVLVKKDMAVHQGLDCARYSLTDECEEAVLKLFFEKGEFLVK